MAFPFPYREERMRSGEPKEESPQRILFPRVYDRENATEASLQNCFDLENERVAALIACYAAGEGKERARGLGTYDVRLNGWFAPFAVLKGLKDVVPEVEEGVEV